MGEAVHGIGVVWREGGGWCVVVMALGWCTTTIDLMDGRALSQTWDYLEWA